MCPQGFGEPIQRGIDELSLKLLLLAAPRTPGSRCLSFPSPFPAGDVSDHVSSPPPPPFPFSSPFSPSQGVYFSFFFLGGGGMWELMGREKEAPGRPFPFSSRPTAPG